MRKIKPSTNSIKDFSFFLNTELDMIGKSVMDETKSQKSGYSALECWYAKDTHGIKLPCKENILLEKAERGKKRNGKMIYKNIKELCLDILVVSKYYIENNIKNSLIFLCDKLALAPTISWDIYQIAKRLNLDVELLSKYLKNAEGIKFGDGNIIVTDFSPRYDFRIFFSEKGFECNELRREYYKVFNFFYNNRYELELRCSRVWESFSTYSSYPTVHWTGEAIYQNT